MLAWGANVFNLGVLSCLVIYPLVYRPLAGDGSRRSRVRLAAIVSCTLSMAAAALGVTIETQVSGITTIPFVAFLMMMVPVHLAIEFVEGVITAGNVTYVAKTQPELLHQQTQTKPAVPKLLRPAWAMISVFLVAALLTGGVMTWFSSDQPDGVERALDGLGHSAALEMSSDELEQQLAGIQENPAIVDRSPMATIGVVSPTKSLEGVVGSILTLGLVVAVGWTLGSRRTEKATNPGLRV